MIIQRILVVAATELEMAPLIKSLGVPTMETDQWFAWQALKLQTLITGPGIPNTSFHLGKRLAGNPPDLLLHIGIAGAKPGCFELGEVVCVQEDRFGDIGVEDATGKFQDMFDLGLWTEDPPWTDGHLVATNPLPFDLPYPSAKGLTVNLIPGTSEHISRMSERYAYLIESMEGAAVLHATRLANVPCLCLRGISNLIEPRNRANWRIDLAVEEVCRAVLALLHQLNGEVD